MVGIFVLVVAIFRYVSLGSVVAAALLPILAWGLHEYIQPRELILLFATSVVIIWKHRPKPQPHRRRNGAEDRSTTKVSRIAIIGAGAWGTALAIVLGRKKTHAVRLWANEPDVCESIMQRRRQRTIPSRIHIARFRRGDKRPAQGS